MKALIVFDRPNFNLSLRIAPLLNKGTTHQLTLERIYLRPKAKSVQVATFFLSTESYCLELLRQLFPEFGHIDTLCTGTVIDAIQANRLKELIHASE